MIVNNKEYNFEELLSNVKFNLRTDNPLGLTQNQILILQRNKIDIDKPTLKEIMFLINKTLENSEDEDLELIYEEISERDYYENKKQ